MQSPTCPGWEGDIEVINPPPPITKLNEVLAGVAGSGEKTLPLDEL